MGWKLKSFDDASESEMSALGHSLPTHSATVPTNVRYAPIATKSEKCCE
jgi:hypothetical protein